VEKLAPLEDDLPFLAVLAKPDRDILPVERQKLEKIGEREKVEPPREGELASGSRNVRRGVSLPHQAGHAGIEFFRVEGLDHVVVGTEPQRLDSLRRISLDGQKNERDVPGGRPRADLAIELPAVHARHQDIGHDGVGREGPLEQSERRCAIGRLEHLEPLPAKGVSDHLPHELAVVHGEQRRADGGRLGDSGHRICSISSCRVGVVWGVPSWILPSRQAASNASTRAGSNWLPPYLWISRRACSRGIPFR